MAAADPQIRLPQQPAIVADLKSCAWLNPDGKIENIDPETARGRIGKTVIPIVCHAHSTARRLNAAPFPTLDILELFAFTHPARFALPTPLGIAEALGLALPSSPERAAESLLASARAWRSCAFAFFNSPRRSVLVPSCCGGEQATWCFSLARTNKVHGQ